MVDDDLPCSLETSQQISQLTHLSSQIREKGVLGSLDRMVLEWKESRFERLLVHLRNIVRWAGEQLIFWAGERAQAGYFGKGNWWRI
jgi:hypothetical protein